MEEDEVDVVNVAVAAEVSRETSVRRKRSLATTENAEEVVVIIAVLEEAALVIVEILEVVEVAMAVATTSEGHQGTVWALAATKFKETRTIAEEVMKMTRPKTFNQ